MSDNSLNIHQTQIDIEDLLQSDNGANISATNQKHLLKNFKQISPRKITSINKKEEQDENNSQQATINGVGD